MKTLIRVILGFLSTTLIIFMISMLWSCNSFNDFLDILDVLIAFIIITVIIAALSVLSSKNFSTVEDCKDSFKDVSYFTKQDIKIMYVVMIIAFVIALACSYKSDEYISVKYPNAIEVLETEFEMSSKNLIVVKSLPLAFSDDTFIKAHYVKEVLDADNNENELTVVYNNMDSDLFIVSIKRLVIIMSTLICSFMYYRLMRCKNYHNTLKNIKTE